MRSLHDVQLGTGGGTAVVSHRPEQLMVLRMHSELGRVFQQNTAEGKIPVFCCCSSARVHHPSQDRLKEGDNRRMHPLVKRLPGKRQVFALPEICRHLAE